MAETRQAYSENRLNQLRDGLAPVEEILAPKPICVYATGSYGRLEAWEESDVDLFFLHDSRDDLPFTTFVRLAAQLVETTAAMGFPEFDGDGRFLEVRNVGDMENVLGSPEDDSTNAFTARMLLLLESQPVYDPALYDQLMEKVVGFYYRDFADHTETFTPSVLLNDILRFWRTLTLNYEHKRLEFRTLVGDELREKKAKSALKNYKLKVSRLSTCFSMVANLSAEPKPVRAETVLELCALTPSQRFERLRDRSAEAAAIVDRLGHTYSEFLACTQRPDEVVLSEFADDAKRKELLLHAASYGDLIYQLLDTVVEPDRFRFLVV